MKRSIKLFIITLAAAVISQSCHFLEVQRVGKSDIPTYFSEASALQPALNGVYGLLYDIYDRFVILYPEVAGDLLDLSSRAVLWEPQYNFSSTYMEETSAVGYIWKYSYNIIQNVNHILFYAPGLKDGKNDAMIDNIVAQALFIRALVHFNLCQVYAQTYTFTSDASHLGVPIMTEIPKVTEKMKRSSVGAVYAQVKNDLETALKTFSESYVFNEYMASPASCKAFLARLALYAGDYGKAVSYSSGLISEFPLANRDNYRKMFVNAATRGGESIFRISGYAQGTSLQSFYNFTEPSAQPSEKLKSLFKDERDVRLTLFKHRAYSKEEKKNIDYDGVCMKFYCTDSTINVKDKHYDPFVFRVSEMYLIKAEALCHSGKNDEAAALVRKLEARALGIAPEDVVLNWSNKEELDRIIMEERMKELCFEGHRLYDIVRRHEILSRNKNSTAKLLTLKYPDYRFVLPIPYLEIESNKEMEQNPSKN